MEKIFHFVNKLLKCVICFFYFCVASGYRANTPGGTLPSHGRMARVSEETMPSPGSVKNQIASLERRISHQEAEEHVRKTGQHRYRATMNYWKELNNASQQQFGPPGTSSHGSTMSMDSTNSNNHRTSREFIDTSLQRLANERRSVRETRSKSRSIQETTHRMRSSTDELDRIGQSNVDARMDSQSRHSREVSLDQGSRHSSMDQGSRHSSMDHSSRHSRDESIGHSRENSLDVQVSSHSRENSLDETIHDDRLRGKTVFDN